MRRRLARVIGLVSAGALAVAPACTPAPQSTPAPARGAAQGVRPPVPGAPAGVTAFVDVAVVPMDSARVLLHQTVLVQGGWITALGPARGITVPAGAVRIEGQGQFLLPGLGDMHAHLPRDNNPVIDTARVKQLAERELFVRLAHGVTTLRNLDGRPWHLGLRARTAAGELWSPRIYTSGEKYTSDRFPIPQWAMEMVMAEKAAGFDFIKLYVPSSEVFDSVVAVAHRVGIRLAGHAPRPRHGASPIQQVLAAP